MELMYLDESGCPGSLPAGYSKVQPILCVAGLMVRQPNVSALTMEWVGLKRKFYPGLCKPGWKPFDWHRAEIKGSDLRRAFRDGTAQRERRAAIGFIDKVVALLERHQCQYCARVWIKEPGHPFGGHSAYAFSVQAMCGHFQHRLHQNGTRGLVIADNRMPTTNSAVSHAIFTQKHRAAGDPFPRLIEVPVFGNSDNHAGLQLCDIVCSCLVIPLCINFFLHGKIQNLHLNTGYDRIGKRYGEALKRLQYRHPQGERMGGGLVVSDPIGGLGAHSLFRHYCPPPPVVTITRPASGPSTIVPPQAGEPPAADLPAA